MNKSIILKFITIQLNYFSPYCFLALFVLFNTTVFSQSEKNIEGKLLDKSGEAVISASVFLKKPSGEIVTYAISDENGIFELTTISIGTYILEVSHISYALYSETITLTETAYSYPFSITLQPKNNNLDEIVIQGKKAVAQQKGDTLSYNLGAFTTGNEQKLKDIIEKLPGLEIDENGKIKSEGKVIGNLLVDGKPFFGDNHKIATDNLNAEMIKGIEVLKNYETFDALKEIEGSKETALNIQIKEEYKGRPTGNIEAYGAYKERYRLHTNLFSFAKTHNLSFIGDINNTADQPLSLLDFIQMDKSVDIRNKEDEISSIGSGSGLPSFLLDNNNRTKQQSKFGALNAVFTPLENMAIEVFSILDMEDIKSKQFSERQYFSQTATLYSEELIREENDFLINQTNINAEYKPNANSILKYTFNFKPQDNEFFTNIDGEVETIEQNTAQNIKNQGHTLGQNIGYTSRLSSNKLLAINGFSNRITKTTKLFLSSNRPLFDLGNTISQQLESNSEEYGVYSKYTQRIKDYIFKFNLGYVWEKSKFYDITESNDAISLNHQNYLHTGASAEKKEGFLQYKVFFNLRNYHNSFNGEKEDAWLFLPALEGKLSFSKTHYVSANYTRQTGFPEANQLNTFPYVIDYRNYRNNTNADFSEPIINNRFGFQYFYFNLYSGTQILFNSFYDKTKNAIGVNNDVDGIYNYSNFLNVPYKSNWTNTLRFQTRINPIKTIFKLKLDYSHIEFNNFLNGNQNKAVNKQYKIKPSLASYFKDSWINYEIGVDYEHNNTFFDLTELENQGSKTSPFINLEGAFLKYWTYRLNNALSYYKTSTIKREFHQLDFEVRYKKEDSKFSYWVSGNNILNISNAQIVEAIAMQNSIARNIVYQMPGYIGIGASYDF